MQIKSKIRWRFNKKAKLPFGKAFYIVGSIPQLGGWSLQNAIKLIWHQNDNWSIQILLSETINIEYKYVISDYDSVLKNPQWESGQNYKLQEIMLQSDNQTLKIMSFNIRYQNNYDGSNSWVYRKYKCIQQIYQTLPSIIGFQEVLPSQKKFIIQNLRNYYTAVGIPRDLKQGQENTILFLTNRFFLHDSGHIWFSQSKKPGVSGYDSVFPRLLEYAILQDTISNEHLIFINTHFDHQSERSRQKSIQIMIDAIQKLTQSKQGKFDIANIYITGDFNTTEDNYIFQKLYNEGFKSCRNNAIISDNSSTFHDFEGENYHKSTVIDHIFYRCNRNPINFSIKKSGKPYSSDHYPIIGEFAL